MADIEKVHHDRTATGATANGALVNPNLRTIANPAPLGLFSFASTTLILSLFNVQVRHVTVPNMVLGMAIACGGGAQLLAGMWEFACGNTFGATAFSSYGAFWIAYALIFIPGAGILEAYSAVPTEIDDAVGVFLLVWFIVTFIFLIASLRSTVALVALFFFLDLTFMLLMIGSFLRNETATKAGGGLGIVTAFIAYYAGASALITHDNSFLILPSGSMPKRRV